MGIIAMGRPWSTFWRKHDFWADDYVVRLGQEDALIGAIKMYKHVDVVQPYLLSNRPYTAKRLDRLEW